MRGFYYAVISCRSLAPHLSSLLAGLRLRVSGVRNYWDIPSYSADGSLLYADALLFCQRVSSSASLVSAIGLVQKASGRFPRKEVHAIKNKGCNHEYCYHYDGFRRMDHGRFMASQPCRRYNLVHTCIIFSLRHKNRTLKSPKQDTAYLHDEGRRQQLRADANQTGNPARRRHDLSFL